VKVKGNQKTKVNIVTLGCSKNLVDSENLLTQLRGNGIDAEHEAKNDNSNVVVEGNETNIYGNVGEIHEITGQILVEMRDINDLLAEPDTLQPQSDHPMDGSRKKWNMIPAFGPCPMCVGGKPFMTLFNTPSFFMPGSDKGGMAIPSMLTPSASTTMPRVMSPIGCPMCHGTGVSTSSAFSLATPNIKKQIIPFLIKSKFSKISELENRMNGGKKTDLIAKTWEVHVGGTMNDANSVRVNPVGKQVISGVHISPAGEAVIPKLVAKPQVSAVSVPSLGAGDIFMYAADKFNLMVGSNGIGMKTTGCVDLQGRITTILGDQIVVSSNNHVLVNGGQLLQLKGDTISISATASKENNIALDGIVGVTKNLIVRGGAHVEGTFSCNHIQGPLQYNQTEVEVAKGYLIPGKTIGITSDGKTVTSLPSGSPQLVTAHSHAMPVVAQTTMETSDCVRRGAAIMNSSFPTLAKIVSDSFLRKLPQCIPLIGALDPSLFALFEDCSDNEEAFQKLMDGVMDGTITKEEARALFRKTSDSPIASKAKVVDEDCNPCG